MPHRARVALIFRTLCLLAAPAALLLSLSAPAGAATWTELPGSRIQSTDNAAGIVRLGDGSLLIGYKTPSADPSKQSLTTGVILRGGGVVGGPRIVADWASVNVPALVSAPGGLRAFWGGIKDPAIQSPVPGLETATSPSAGGPWTPQFGGIDVANCKSDLDPNCPPGYLAELYTYASNPSAATLGDGSTLQAWQAGSLGVFAHHGTTPPRDTDGENDDDDTSQQQINFEGLDDPAAYSGRNFQDQPGSISGCCGYSPRLALDARTGRPSVAWFSNATGWQGVYVQEVDPSSGNPLGGQPWHAPGSQAIGTDLRGVTPLTARPGQFGVVTAFTTGSPARRVLVWTAPYHSTSGALLSTPNPVVVSNGPDEVRNINITADSSGRLWLMWTRDVGGPVQVFAARSDAAPGSLHFGAPVSVRAPSGTDDSFAIEGSPSGNSLDVIGTFGSSVNEFSAVWHARLAPGESASAKTVTVASGHKATVAVSVADAGRPLAGATVTVVGRASNARAHHHHRPISARTNRHGVAKLRVGPFAHGMTLRLRVTKSGYTTSSLGVRIKVRRPRHH
jgi:hypothetical protein